MKKLATTLATLGAVGLAPLIAFAQTAVNSFFDLLARLNEIINVIVPFVIGLAVLVIIWGVFNYIIGAGDEEKRAQAKQYIVWGVIGVFIMLSVWGLVSILTNTFNFDKIPEEAPIVNPDELYGTRSKQ